jgi:hypothetical protein
MLQSTYASILVKTQTPDVHHMACGMVSQAGSTLRASLSASGSMVLYNLELDLQSLLNRVPFSVRRAFAHRLTVTVRWASLTIQVHCWSAWHMFIAMHARCWCLVWPASTDIAKLHAVNVP